MYGVSFEEMSVAIRIGENHVTPLDDFNVFLLGCREDAMTCKLWGLVDSLDQEAARLIRDGLYRRGYRIVKYLRMRNGREHEVRHSLREPRE
jgi:hypothetical protein